MRRNEKQHTVAASTLQRANELMNMEGGYARGSNSPRARQYGGGSNSPHVKAYAGRSGHPVGISKVSRQPVGRGGPKFRFNAKVVVRPYS